ncbi:MAG: hypothetical protein U0354_04335 [Candidatus Sericytochromatia bacterium]
MIVKRKKIDNGWSLVTVTLVSALMLSVTGAVLTKVLSSSKEIVRAKSLGKIDSIADTVTSNSLNWLNERSWNSSTGTFQNLELNGVDFIKDLYGTSATNLLATNTNANLSVTTEPFIAEGIKTSNNLDPNKSFFLKDFLENKTTRTLNFLSGGSLSKMNSFIIANAGTPNLSLCLTPLTTQDCIDAYKWGINELSNKLYRKYDIEYGEGSNKVKAEARISIIPLSTNINGLSDQEMHAHIGTTGNIQLIPMHNDIYKMTTKICVPSCSSLISGKQIEMIVSRPIVTGANIPDFAIYANGNIDLGNADTSSGTTITVADTHEGDVHSNSNVNIGSTGYVGGKVTSAQIVTIDPSSVVVPDSGIPATGHSLSGTPRVYDKTNSKSHVDPIPKPDLNFQPYPTTACSSTTGWSASPKVLENCVVSGNYDLSGTEEFRGKVYITGNLKSKGGDNFKASGSTPVHVIVDGTIDLGGNSGATSTQEVIFVSNYSGTGSAITIAGNPGTGTDVGAVFYTTQSNSDIKVMGTADFFGSIIASGTVTSGGDAKIRKDTDLSALKKSLPPSRKDLLTKITSWKEVPLSLN